MSCVAAAAVEAERLVPSHLLAVAVAVEDAKRLLCGLRLAELSLILSERPEPGARAEPLQRTAETAAIPPSGHTLPSVEREAPRPRILAVAGTLPVWLLCQTVLQPTLPPAFSYVAIAAASPEAATLPQRWAAPVLLALAAAVDLARSLTRQLALAAHRGRYSLPLAEMAAGIRQ